MNSIINKQFKQIDSPSKRIITVLSVENDKVLYNCEDRGRIKANWIKLESLWKYYKPYYGNTRLWRVLNSHEGSKNGS